MACGAGVQFAAETVLGSLGEAGIQAVEPLLRAQSERIVNSALRNQYVQLMNVLRYKRKPTDEDDLDGASEVYEAVVDVLSDEREEISLI